MAPKNSYHSHADGKLWQTLKGLWPYIWPHDRADLKLRVALALLSLVVAKIVTVLVPFAYKWATNALTGDDPFATPESALIALLVTPIMLVIAYGVGRVMMMVFNQMRDALFARVGQHAVRQLAYKTFVHMHKLSLRFHLERRTGGLSRIIERGVKGIEVIVRFTILFSIPTVLEFLLVAVVVGYLFDWWYVLVISIMIVLYTWFTVVASNWRIAIRRDMNNADTDSNSKAVDSLLNYETVKYFNNEEMESQRFDKSMAKYEIAATRTWTSLAWLNIGQSVIFTGAMVVCMVMAAQGVLDGTLTIGDFVFINALLLQLYQPLNFIGTVYREIQQGLVDIETMFNLLEQNPEIKDKPDAKPLKVSKGTVEFDKVRFAYDEARPILKGVSFTVPAGKTIAVVGPSGAGKSTISRLLFRFYDVNDGAIRIDGQDIRDVEQQSVRHAIGMVPQDTVLFNDTIRYNIAYGRPDASLAEIEKAAELAQIDAFIKDLPEGYESMVGERGLKLSGGEKQRVAIARTILKSPPILILDEATSALDTFTEKEIQAALNRVAEGRTAIVIAHRLSTVVDADEIIVLVKGEVKERGTHTQLLTAGGVYADMWARQQEAAEAEERLKKMREENPELFRLQFGEETQG